MDKEHLNNLLAEDKKSQEDYDKAIISLSGGALGLSFAIIDDIVGESTPVFVWAIASAWGSWAASISAVVLSYYFSHRALRKAIVQAYKNDRSEQAGGIWSTITAILNILSGAFFVSGVICLIIFTINNFGATT